MKSHKIPIYFIIIILLLVGLTTYAFCQDTEVKQKTKPAEGEGEITEKGSIMDIKPLDADETLFSVELRDVELSNLIRMLAHNYKLNIWMDKDVKGKVTASFTNITLEELIKTIAESSNLVFKKEGNVIKVKPNLITKVFVLQYIEARSLVREDPGKKEAKGITEEATIFDLLSDKGKILLGEQPNSIMVIDYPPNIQKIEEYLKAVDHGKTSRVFKLKYLSVSDLFPELEEEQREVRKKHREEIEQEREALGKVGVMPAGGGD